VNVEMSCFQTGNPVTGDARRSTEPATKVRAAAVGLNARSHTTFQRTQLSPEHPLFQCCVCFFVICSHSDHVRMR